MSLSEGRGFREVMASSLLAQWTQKALLHPVDTIKGRLQYQRGLPSIGLIREQLRNPHSLYRGLGPALAAGIPTAMMYMPVYEMMLRIIAEDWRLPKHLASPAAAVCSGLAVSVVRVPLSVIKHRVQLNLERTGRASAARIWQTRGLRGFYAGWGATATLDIAVAVVQFTSLQRFKAIADAAGFQDGHVNIGVGLCAGTLTALCTEPLDVVRVRIVAQARGELQGTAFNYRSVWHGLVSAARDEGLLCLWKGMLPRLVYTACSGAVWFGAYRQALRLFPEAEEGLPARGGREAVGEGALAEESA